MKYKKEGGGKDEREREDEQMLLVKLVWLSTHTHSGRVPLSVSLRPSSFVSIFSQRHTHTQASSAERISLCLCVCFSKLSHSLRYVPKRTSWVCLATHQQVFVCLLLLISPSFHQPPLSMRFVSFLHIFGVCLFKALVIAGARVDRWTHSVVVDADGHFRVNWAVDDSETETIEFNVCARTQGWLALGFSSNGQMAGSDIVLTWVDGSGRAHLQVS